MLARQTQGLGCECGLWRPEPCSRMLRPGPVCQKFMPASEVRNSLRQAKCVGSQRFPFARARLTTRSRSGPACRGSRPPSPSGNPRGRPGASAGGASHSRVPSSRPVAARPRLPGARPPSPSRNRSGACRMPRGAAHPIRLPGFTPAFEVRKSQRQAGCLSPSARARP